MRVGSSQPLSPSTFTRTIRSGPTSGGFLAKVRLRVERLSRRTRCAARSCRTRRGRGDTSKGVSPRTLLSYAVLGRAPTRAPTICTPPYSRVLRFGFLEPNPIARPELQGPYGIRTRAAAVRGPCPREAAFWTDAQAERACLRGPGCLLAMGRRYMRARTRGIVVDVQSAVRGIEPAVPRIAGRVALLRSTHASAVAAEFFDAGASV